ncbi:hypothetical protein [Streptomyces sp. NPDC007205]|uniref:hypothetical protein n=1 Tax=Streptomyces sp. NPDC007205 TaxID=3154316 RepID=UPI0033DB3180
MARLIRKSAAPTRPLLKVPVRLGAVDTAALIAELRQLHEDAEDENVGRMPADEELYQALLYLEAHSGALKSEEARRKAAITRVKLWEYLREQADVRQGKAIEDARAAKVEWTALAESLAVNTASAAYNKAKRLRATTLMDPERGDRPVRRTPEAVLVAERRAAAKAAAERRMQEEAARHHALLAPVAQRLIEHRAGLDDDDEVTFWLDQVAAVLPDCETPIQIVSLGRYVEAVVRELRRSERESARPAARTNEARLAYAAATAVLSRGGKAP